MKNLKEQKPNVENIQAVDLELNEQQLEAISGGIIDGGGCVGGLFTKPIKLPPIFLPPAPSSDDNVYDM